MNRGPQQSGKSRSRNRNRNRNRNRGKKKTGQPQKPQGPQPADDVQIQAPKQYGIVFYDTLPAAKADLETIRSKTSGVDQLNIVIRSEADMDDPELNDIGPVKVFAGAAWTLIHERRMEDGWYEKPQ